MITTTSERLSNGLTLWRVQLPGTEVVTAALAFPAGSRYEQAGEIGLAHFAEHAVFKGCGRYPSALAINRRAEELGAFLNAFTAHPAVCFHATARREAALDALDLLSEMVATPLLDPTELERERGAILQEINGSNDDPDDVVFRELIAAIYGDNPLGRLPLGTAESVAALTSADVARFMARQWSPRSGVALLVGATEHLDNGRVCEALNRLLPTSAAPPPVPAPTYARNVRVAYRDTSQAHLQIAFEPTAPLETARQRAALSLYSILLGGSMSSRLFEELRVQRGLCYTVESAATETAETPNLQIHAGLETARCREAFVRMVETVRELSADGPTRAEVERARSYRLGATVISSERPSNVIGACMDLIFCHHEEPDPNIFRRALEEVSYADVVEAARGIDPRPAVACVGEVSAADFEL